MTDPRLHRQAGTEPAKSKVSKKPIVGTALAMILGVIAVEGGYVNHKADPGGETNMGVTKVVAVKNGYTGPMRALPQSVAVSIYYDDYIVRPGFEPLIAVDAPVTEELFDTGVNMGPAKPSRWLQQSINEHCSYKLTVDGRVGPGTVRAYKSCQIEVGAAKFCRVMLDSLDGKQRAEYERIVRARPQSGVFLKGWLRHRVGNVDRAKCAVKAVS